MTLFSKKYREPVLLGASHVCESLAIVTGLKNSFKAGATELARLNEFTERNQLFAGTRNYSKEGLRMLSMANSLDAKSLSLTDISACFENMAENQVSPIPQDEAESAFGGVWSSIKTHLSNAAGWIKEKSSDFLKWLKGVFSPFNLVTEVEKCMEKVGKSNAFTDEERMLRLGLLSALKTDAVALAKISAEYTDFAEGVVNVKRFENSIAALVYNTEYDHYGNEYHVGPDADTSLYFNVTRISSLYTQFYGNIAEYGEGLESLRLFVMSLCGFLRNPSSKVVHNDVAAVLKHLSEITKAMTGSTWNALVEISKQSTQLLGAATNTNPDDNLKLFKNYSRLLAKIEEVTLENVMAIRKLQVMKTN